jgi:hypothetical protein
MEETVEIGCYLVVESWARTFEAHASGPSAGVSLALSESRSEGKERGPITRFFFLSFLPILLRSSGTGYLHTLALSYVFSAITLPTPLLS